MVNRQLGASRYEQVYGELFDWMAGERFEGYDPYDGCMTRYEPLRAHRPVRLFLTYFHKFSPLNLRPLFGIAPMRNCYALSLVHLALLRTSGWRRYADLLEEHLAHILSQSLYEQYGFHCWNANGLYIQSLGDYQTPDIPGAVGTEMCGLAILQHYRHVHADERLADVLRSIRDFFLNVLLTRNGDALYFRYKPTSHDWELTYNASIKAAVLITEINRTFGWSVGNDVARACLDFVVSKQREDGAWRMGLDFRTGREKPQIDFHQGFVLDAILQYLDLCGPDPCLEDAYRRGVRFYREHQFLDDGRCHYRYPKLWPLNIHNQSQGVITFTQAARIDPAYGDFARTVADWTIANMRDKKGYFYYHKYPGVTVRIPFMRWSQANMLYALTFLTGDADTGKPVLGAVHADR